MTRTEFYKELPQHGRGDFSPDDKGRIRTEKGHDPLSFVAWKLHGLDAKGEITRPGRALGIKNPMRLVLASDLARGHVGSTRRALLESLGLIELKRPDRLKVMNEGGTIDPRTGRVNDYDPDAVKSYPADAEPEEADVLPTGQPPTQRQECPCGTILPEGVTGFCTACNEARAQQQPYQDADEADAECDCTECRRERGELV